MHSKHLPATNDWSMSERNHINATLLLMLTGNLQKQSS